MLHFVNKPVPVHKFNKVQHLLLVKLITAITRSYSEGHKYAKCYKILELPNDADQESVRKAFISLCKKYHPDSGNPSANAEKFQEIESAYRSLQNKFASERWNVNEGIGEYGLYYKEKKQKNEKVKPEVFDIKHTAPQHRQYLSYEGVGSGTPSQREKQYAKYKTVVAVENVYNHHIKKLSQNDSSATLIVKDKREAKKIKTRYGMDRLVEDLIQESMAQGHFDNLKGQGKPLPPSNYNPYVDFVTHKMNQVLIDNGFTPEWISLQKEISDDIEDIKRILSKERKKLGPLPLSISENNKWREAIERLTPSVDKLNKKINKFNLLVPILEKQRMYFSLEKESCDILKNGLCSDETEKEETRKVASCQTTPGNANLFNLFFQIFK